MAEGKRVSRIGCVAVMVALMALPFGLPCPEGLTQSGFKVLGIFLGCVFGWSTVGVMGTSLLGMVFLGFVPEFSVQGVFKEGFGGTTFMLVFFMVTFAGVLDQVGLGERVAQWILRRKFTRRGPWVLSLSLLLTAYVTSFVTSVMPGIIISWGILSSICHACGYKRGDSWPKLMTVGIVLACCMGHSAWPIEVLSFTLLGIYDAQGLPPINYLSFTVLNTCIGLGAMGLYLTACQLLFKPDVDRLSRAYDFARDMGPLTRAQKAVVAFTVVFFAVLFLPGAFPGAGGLLGLLESVGTVGCAVVVLAAAGMARMADGKPLVNLPAAIRDGAPWESMILIACAIPLSSALTNADVGLSPLFSHGFSVLFGSVGSAALFSVLFVVVVVLLTNVMGNVTVGVVLLPIMIAAAPSMGANAALLTVVTCIACNAAFLLPSGGPTAAVLHGNRDWFAGSSQIYPFAAAGALSFVLSALSFMLVLGPLLF